MLEAEPARQRWWIRPPMPDETLRSVINRAAALYECPPKRLWECLNWDDPQPYGEIDSPALRVLRRMAIAMGLPPSDLSAQRLPDAPWLLAPQADEVYCPLCWTDDRRRGDPLWFRRGGGGFFAPGARFMDSRSFSAQSSGLAGPRSASSNSPT